MFLRWWRQHMCECSPLFWIKKKKKILEWPWCSSHVRECWYFRVWLYAWNCFVSQSFYGTFSVAVGIFLSRFFFFFFCELPSYASAFPSLWSACLYPAWGCFLKGLHVRTCHCPPPPPKSDHFTQPLCFLSILPSSPTSSHYSLFFFFP